MLAALGVYDLQVCLLADCLQVLVLRRAPLFACCLQMLLPVNAHNLAGAQPFQGQGLLQAVLAGHATGTIGNRHIVNMDVRPGPVRLVCMVVDAHHPQAWVPLLPAGVFRRPVPHCIKIQQFPALLV